MIPSFTGWYIKSTDDSLLFIYPANTIAKIFGTQKKSKYLYFQHKNYWPKLMSVLWLHFLQTWSKQHYLCLSCRKHIQKGAKWWGACVANLWICEGASGKRCQLGEVGLVCPSWRAVRICLLPFTSFQLLLHSIHHFIPNPTLFSGLRQSYKLSACPSYRLLRYAIMCDFNAMYRNLQDQSQEETVVVGLFACDKLPCESCPHYVSYTTWLSILAVTYIPIDIYEIKVKKRQRWWVCLRVTSFRVRAAT